MAMVLREELLFLPNSKKQNDGEGAQLNMKKRHLWILGLTFALIISWNILLTLHSLRTTNQHEFSQLVKTLLARENNEVKDFISSNVLCLFQGAKGKENSGDSDRGRHSSTESGPRRSLQFERPSD